jgi:hypothetical protein
VTGSTGFVHKTEGWNIGSQRVQEVLFEPSSQLKEKTQYPRVRECWVLKVQKRLIFESVEF